MKLTHDLTDIHTDKVKHTLQTLKYNENMEKKLVDNLTPKDTKTPNFYLLPKIHKKQTHTTR